MQFVRCDVNQVRAESAVFSQSGEEDFGERSCSCGSSRKILEEPGGVLKVLVLTSFFFSYLRGNYS